MKERNELVFSYNAQHAAMVQNAALGRELLGKPDALPGYALLANGGAHSSLARLTGVTRDRVEGMAYLLSATELRRCDEGEAKQQKRIRVRLASGKHAWVYVPAPRRSPWLVIVDA